ncbi:MULTISPECIES: hypothetical protein [Streptomyces]|nr:MULTISPECIES: hypothetical protein [Streptomyces]
MANGDMEVSMQLSDCVDEDVEAVFGMIGAVYPSDWETGATRQGHREVCVWTTQFDMAPDSPPAQPVELAQDVAAELQGAPRAVRKLQAVLGDAFHVSEEMVVAGDQELQVQLRLRNR